MKVRVFVPCAPDPVGRPVFSGSDHMFPMLPSVGHVLHFREGRGGDFTVVRAGFVQDDEVFVAAIWLEANGSSSAYNSRVAYDAEPQEGHRDLNHDVPPASMTTY